MPIRVLDLVNKRKEIEVEWEGEHVKLAYRPYSQTIEDEMSAVGESHGQSIEQLKALLLWWDLVGDDGKPAPIDYATLCLLPSPLLIAMNRAIVANLYPNQKSAETIVAG